MDGMTIFTIIAIILATFIVVSVAIGIISEWLENKEKAEKEKEDD